MTSNNKRLKTYFGRSEQPYKEGYHTEQMNIRVNDDDSLTVRCNRCYKDNTVRPFKIHPDGAITFNFYCHNCQLSFGIYRNVYEDFDKVRKAIFK